MAHTVPSVREQRLSLPCTQSSFGALQIRTPPPPAPPPKDARASKAKAREKRREAPVEQEVDRIIDSQDNEYVLSRPKCALRRAAGSAGGGCCMRSLVVERFETVLMGEIRNEAVLS